MKILILEYEDRDGKINFCPSMPKQNVTITLPPNVSSIVTRKRLDIKNDKKVFTRTYIKNESALS